MTPLSQASLHSSKLLLSHLFPSQSRSNHPLRLVENMGQQSSNRSTFFRLLLGEYFMLADGVLRKCSLSRESTRSTVVACCIDQVIDIDPNTFQSLNILHISNSLSASIEMRNTCLHLLMLGRSSSIPTSWHNLCQLPRLLALPK
jgi:hypothetical protein